MSKQQSEKIQKVLARAGFGSRRQMEAWILEGRIEVNGRQASLGDRISTKDRVKVDGKLVSVQEEKQPTRIIMYHKPVGQICTRRDPEGRPTVFRELPKIKNGRWISIGRLDINTSGLLLFTNDGELANGLMHPSNQVEREYAVRILGKADETIMQRLTNGVQLADGFARFEHIVDSGGDAANHWYHVVVVEGRNRLVRRLWESQGFQVSRLMRVRFGPVFLEKSLRPKQSREITGKLFEKLIAMTSTQSA